MIDEKNCTLLKKVISCMCAKSSFDEICFTCLIILLKQANVRTDTVYFFSQALIKK